MPKSKDILTKRLDNYQSKPDKGIPHRLGNGVTVEVPGKPYMSYVTEFTTGVVSEVLNVRVSTEKLDELVLVGIDPNSNTPTTKQVLGPWNVYTERKVSDIPPHSHTYPENTTWVKGEQFLPSLVVPVSGQLQVDVYPNIYKTLTGFKEYTDVTRVSFASSVPSPYGTRITLLVADGSGNYVFRDGPIVGNRNVLSDTDLPAAQIGDTVIYGIICYGGQTEAVQDDLKDFRTANSITSNIPATTASNDFMVGDGTSWAKKTLAQTVTILRTVLDVAYAATFAPLVHVHAAADVTTGTLDGDRLPSISSTKKGAVPATGTIDLLKFLRHDGNWAVPAGGSGGGGGAGELLFQDGVTAPPVPLENEARNDWLYQG